MRMDKFYVEGLQSTPKILKIKQIISTGAARKPENEKENIYYRTDLSQSHALEINKTLSFGYPTLP